MMRWMSLALTASALAIGALAPRTTIAQIAVIVHPDNPIAGMEADELRRYFLGERTRFASSQHVSIAQSAPARKRFVQSALHLTEDAVRRRWIAVAFRGEATEMPRDLPDDAQTVAFVAAHPGALAYVSASAVDARVKVLAIDGKRPADAGYSIR